MNTESLVTALRVLDSPGVIYLLSISPARLWAPWGQNCFWLVHPKFTAWQGTCHMELLSSCLLHAQMQGWMKASLLAEIQAFVLVVQLLSHVRLFGTPWTAARQASLSFTVFQSLLKLISTESVMPSNHHILCCPLLFLSSVFPSIRVFSSELALCISWPK